MHTDIFMCIYILIYTWYSAKGGAAEDATAVAWGSFWSWSQQLLIVKSPHSILISAGCWGEVAPSCFFLYGSVGDGYGECLFPAMPVPSSQLPGFLGWHRDADVSPSNPCPSHAASATTEWASACQVL